MIDLNFKCVQCAMKIDEIPPVAQSCENYIHCVFDLCPDWQAMDTIVANFKCGTHGNVVSVPVENGECMVPASVIKWPDFRMSLFGTNGDMHISTVIVEVPVLLNNLENGEPEPNDPDIFDAILNSCTMTQDEMDQFRADAAAGVFNGKPFEIYKIYNSVADMNEDAANVPNASFVLISSGVDDPDNAKLFVKNVDVFDYVTDMSGATGIQGPIGPTGPQGIQGIQGETGPGVAAGGSTGQILYKKSNANYDTQWKSMPAGGIEHVTTTGTGAAYKATSTTVSATPTNGDRLLVIPHCVSTVLSPTLAVNGGSAHPIARRLSTDSGQFENLNSLYVFNIGDAVELMFDSSAQTWILVNNPKVNAEDLDGVVPIAHGGTGVTTKEAIGLLAYPVGAIYITTVSTSPATLFGGTWQRIQDTFLLAAGSTYAAGTTGGEATHTLTVNEMPAHDHRPKGWALDSAYQSGQVQRLAVDASNYDNWTQRTTSEGGGAAHNNMPPYLAVYVWKRTA